MTRTSKSKAAGRGVAGARNLRTARQAAPEPRRCRQCFDSDVPVDGDGFCSDFCASSYDREIGGEP